MSTPVGLVSVFLLGTLHALEPGHGKSFLAAYLIGEDKLKIKNLLALGFSMLISHFLVLAVFAFILKSVFAGINQESFHEILDWVGPIAIIVFGLFLFIRYKTGHSHSHESSQKNQHPLLVGAISGLLPCPTALAPVMLAGIDSNFTNSLAYIFIYVLGMCLLLLFLCVVFFSAKDFSKKHLHWFHANYNIHLLSSILIVFVGVIYLALKFFEHSAR